MRLNRNREGLFPQQLWNNYNRVLNDLPRSNNVVEAWHRRFHSVVCCDHPTIWRLINSLKSEEAYYRRRIEQLLAGADQPRKKNMLILTKELKLLFRVLMRLNLCNIYGASRIIYEFFIFVLL